MVVPVFGYVLDAGDVAGQAVESMEDHHVEALERGGEGSLGCGSSAVGVGVDAGVADLSAYEDRSRVSRVIRYGRGISVERQG